MNSLYPLCIVHFLYRHLTLRKFPFAIIEGSKLKLKWKIITFTSNKRMHCYNGWCYIRFQTIMCQIMLYSAWENVKKKVHGSVFVSVIWIEYFGRCWVKSSHEQHKTIFFRILWLVEALLLKKRYRKKYKWLLAATFCYFVGY